MPEEIFGARAMIENIRCEAGTNESGEQNFSLKWRWIVPPGQTLPSLKLYCCPISVDELLSSSLFENDTISQHIIDKINLAGGVEQWRNANPGKYIFRYCRLSPNGNVQHESEITIDEIDCVCFFCMVDSNTGEIFKYWTSKAKSGGKIKYKAKSAGILFSSSKKREIALEGQNSRRVVLKHGNEYTTYSLLAKGHQKYYINADIEDFELMYLLDLIKVAQTNDI